MASSVKIVNLALTSLGEERIVSLDDETKPAREAKAIYDEARDAIMAGYSWSFAMGRRSLSALSTTPDHGYSLEYQLPTDCLRIVQVGEYFVGIDLSDMRGSTSEEFMVEGRKILTNMGAPLKFRYVKRIEDTTQFSPNFVMAFAAYMATILAEPLTQSDTKRERALQWLTREVSLAIKANAIELPPKKLADDEWLASRR